MSISIDEQYKRLEQTRMLLNPKVIPEKKRKIWEYFRGFQGVDITNLEKRIRTNTILYRAPLFKIHGSNMVYWPTNNGEDIYIDQEFVIKPENADIINQQLTHETLHSLCRTDDKKMFGHITTSENAYLKGINEATTQVFTDDIEGNLLGPKDDYLYFIKNIMRIIKSALSPESVANQFLNNNTDFEDRFNEITNDKFNDFAFILNSIYTISKQKHYTSINEQQEDMLISNQNLILQFTSTFVKKVANNDPNVYSRIKVDSFSKEFLPNLKIEQLNNNVETK